MSPETNEFISLENEVVFNQIKKAYEPLEPCVLAIGQRIIIKNYIFEVVKMEGKNLVLEGVGKKECNTKNQKKRSRQHRR